MPELRLTVGCCGCEGQNEYWQNKKFRINFRGLCKVELGETNRRDKNPPIKLEGEDEIDYCIVSTYMN